jgi:NADH dehydrogenase
MSMRVFVTGGTGFVGSAIIDELLSRGHRVDALVNRKELPPRPGVTSIKNGLFDPVAIDAGMKGCDALIHVVGIIMEKPAAGITFQKIHVEGTRAVVDAAKRHGIRRYVQMSALGTRADAVSDYHRTKFEAEQYVETSGLDWTIIRPSLIHGPGGEFMRMEANWARKKAPPFLFMPYFGAGMFGTGGAGKLQPVFVNDVARAFVDCMDKPHTIGKTYNLGGSEQLTWPQMHTASATAIVGHRRAVMALPAWYANVLTHIVPRTLLPFNRDQVIMSQEDNTCDLAPFITDFGWTPGGLTEDMARYANCL